MTANLFSYGTMITDPARFIGRVAQREQIVARLNSGSAQAFEKLLASDIIERVEGGIRFEVELTRRWWHEFG